jgi:transcriptional regulator with XRE-family HTH domain
LVDHATLAIVLRAFRSMRGYSQERLADIAGFDRTYVQKIESGKKKPAFIVVDRLRAALDVSWTDFGTAIDKELRKR